jgi:hypothetical protein
MSHYHYHDKYTDEEEATDYVYGPEAMLTRLASWQIPTMIEDLRVTKEDSCWIMLELSYEFQTTRCGGRLWTDRKRPCELPEARMRTLRRI